MSVNSVAVLRLMGKGGGASPVGVARGRGGIRGGRGEVTLTPSNGSDSCVRSSRAGVELCV